MSDKRTRYQGAIIKDHHILLLKQRIYSTGKIVWLFPGGGMEPGETEEECVKREIREETHLNVQVVSLLVDEPYTPEDPAYGVLKNYKTYYCEQLSGVASPGIEPEYNPKIHTLEAPDILETKWFDLRSDKNWDSTLVNDPIIYLPLQYLRKKLGYIK
jgi:8-oxo-dGTP pyrophosphatase MutT (NUDIX family)